MTTCTLDEPYISIYDKPKRPRGRSKVLTDEQINERNRLIYKKHYDNNRDYYVFKQRIYYELNKERDNARRRAKYHEQKNQN